MKKALITGITGQDGSYLAELLLDKGYEVHGIVRRVALEDPVHRLWRISHMLDKIMLHAGSLESYASLFNVVEKVRPDECYHLAAQSFVQHSFEDAFSTILGKYSKPKQYAENIERHFMEFYNLCVEAVRTNSYTRNDLQSFITLGNFLEAFDVDGIYRCYNHTNLVPKVLVFDLDSTLMEMFGHEQDIRHNNQYYFVEDLEKILQKCNRLREKYGVVIAIATRHYAPVRLYQELINPESPLYHENFDIIISQYTGELSQLDAFCDNYFRGDRDFCRRNLFELCEDERNGCQKGKYGFRKITETEEEPGRVWYDGLYDESNEIFSGGEYGGVSGFSTKIPHFDEIVIEARAVREKRSTIPGPISGEHVVKHEDMILFDDSDKYILREHREQTLGGKVFTAGVRRPGLTYSLFEKAIAIFTYQKLVDIVD